ncbi:MAG: PSD1 and planctomycete cytochrome C domain-containing protein [Rubripirellula sp.]
MKLLALFFGFCAFVGVVNGSANDFLEPEELAFFESKIRPVLIRECYGCHSKQSGNARGGLTLDTKERMAIGGTTGPAVVPGRAEESWLFNAIAYEDLEMPPSGRLPDEVIEDFRRWIEMGAPDPRTNSVEAVQSSITEQQILEAKATFWAYKPPAQPVVPTPADLAWASGEIDQFVRAQHESHQLSPAPDATSSEILRRLTFDLVGLPPTLDQIHFFQQRWELDPQAAIAHVVDRLLESKHFGERWGRHWLDVARYGESSGRAVNMTYPEAWRYRDYVIESFNEDKPFDRFVLEQLAGDLLPVETDEQFAKNLIATTFLAIGSKNVNENNRVQFAADLVDEQIDATTRVFLGTSVACARCHDHKFDPIPQADYYALAGIFQSTKTFFGNPQSELGSFSDATDKQNSTLLILPIDSPNPFALSYSPDELEGFQKQMEEEREAMIASRSAGQAASGNAIRNRLAYLKRMSELSGRLASVDEFGKPKTFCMGVQDSLTANDARLLVRGEIDQPASTIPRGFPQVLTDQQPRLNRESSGRLELAQWIASPENPLTARVMVNRIWMHLLGVGIVSSMEDFGSTGQSPSHPELLDYLAIRFVQSGWSVKSLVRDIVNTRVYRQSSAYRQDYHELDPENSYLWRANARRLDAEAIRDAMLCVSGELTTVAPKASVVAMVGYTRVVGGQVIPSRGLVEVIGKQTQSVDLGFSGQGILQRSNGFPAGRAMLQARGAGRFLAAADNRRLLDRVTNILSAENETYRSVYLPLVRDAEPRSLEVFDFVDASVISGKRESSNTANQSLYLMNNEFVRQRSEAFASRVASAGPTLAEQIDKAVLLVYGRLPTPTEKQVLVDFAEEFSGTDGEGNSISAMPVLCQSLFASAEFLYLD